MKTVKSLLLLFAAGFAVQGPVRAQGTSNSALEISVYNSGEKGMFAVSSEIVAGPHEAILVDAQFARTDAEALVERIKATGKKLKLIYVSHSDPDYYFGLETIRAAFPGARIVATPQTVAAIRATKDGKLAYWGPILKDNAPAAVIVPEAISGDTLSVDGKPVKIVGLDGPAPDRTFLWIPSARAVVGGVSVMANQHVWIADTQTPRSRQNWLKTLDRIEALRPRLVVPAHFLPNADGSQPFTLTSVRFTRNYLTIFEAEAARAKTSGQLIEAMKKHYPGLKGEGSLDISAKVIKGEMKWPA